MMNTRSSFAFWKRFVDVLVAGMMLLLLAPVLVVIALLVRWKLGSPVLFRHLRPGKGGVPFTLLKFRTMTDTRDASGALLPDLERQTNFGNFLRNSSLDELPELLNVLNGEMSLVGPRPLMMEYLPRYTAEQMRRHDVLPGITGWAQVNGRNLISWEFKLDLWYVEHGSLLLDAKILVLTLRKVISREGIAAESHFSAPEFNPATIESAVSAK
jgi:sugar transferase EpsL